MGAGVGTGVGTSVGAGVGNGVGAGVGPKNGAANEKKKSSMQAKEIKQDNNRVVKELKVG